MFRFEWIWLLLLLPLPFLIRRLFPKYSMNQSSLKLPFYDSISAEFSKAKSKPIFWICLFVLAWVSLVVAAARPQWIEQKVNVPMTGRDLLVAIDISGSMQQSDFSVSNESRFEAVRKIAGEFLKRRTGDRVGLILFGTRPYLYAPLTFDVETVVEFLNGAQVGLAGQRTAIGDTIALAVKLLRERPAENRILVLLTDGENSAGVIEPNQALSLVLENGVRIYVIGIGLNYAAANPNLSGAAQYFLPHAAEASGGMYFHASNSLMLERVYRAIDQYEPIEGDEEIRSIVLELYPWFLGIAMMLLSLVVLQNSLSMWVASFFVRKDVTSL